MGDEPKVGERDGMLGGDLLLMARLYRESAARMAERGVAVQAARDAKAADLLHEAAAWQRGERDEQGEA